MVAWKVWPYLFQNSLGGTFIPELTPEFSSEVSRVKVLAGFQDWEEKAKEVSTQSSQWARNTLTLAFFVEHCLPPAMKASMENNQDSL